MAPLVIAYIYDRFESYRALGYSVEQCQEFDSDDTINATIQSLEACGCMVVPVEGIKQLVAMLAENKHKSWDLAFPTAEGMFGGAGREAQVPGLLEAYQIPHVFSDAATLSLTQDKGLAKVRLSPTSACLQSRRGLTGSHRWC
jgi:D-alanine-D-alanine ligase-like ATP-grasp enzyme